MEDHAVTTKVVDAITSTEALAAFLGAFAAFLLEAIRRWRADRLADLAAGKEALLSLTHMYNHAYTVNDQMFTEQAAEFRNTHGREPNYAEFLPMEAAFEDVIRLPKDRLGFLLRTYDTDILNRLVAVDHHFGMMIRLTEERNNAHRAWQEACANYVNSFLMGDAPTHEQLERAAGPDVVFRLRHLTEGLKAGLPECAENLKTMSKQLTEVLSYSFPTKQVLKMRVESEARSITTPPKEAKPRIPQKVVRFISRMLRYKLF